MTTPRFSLVVVSTQDGFIARYPGHSPADWASNEEQTLFFEMVDAADWAVMGRGTHEAADKPHRRRIIFSRSAPNPEWRRRTQIWLDPAQLLPGNLAAIASEIHPMRTVVILGGTTVHDWFLARDSIDEVCLTIEPVLFGDGLPIFSGQRVYDPRAVFLQAGFQPVEDTQLNDAGTRFMRWIKKS